MTSPFLEEVECQETLGVLQSQLPKGGCVKCSCILQQECGIDFMS